MKKAALLFISVAVLSVAGYFAGINLSGNVPNGDKDASLEANIDQPERKPEIYGKVKSIIGNEVLITKSDSSVDPTVDMSPADKQKYMKSLDEADRLKLKEEILNATLGDVKVVMSVGMPMSKKTAQGPDAATVDASLSDLKIGGVVSVWLDQAISDRNVAEFVKIAYSN